MYYVRDVIRVLDDNKLIERFVLTKTKSYLRLTLCGNAQKNNMLVSAETDVLTMLHFIVRRKMQLYKSDDSVRANNFGGNESNFEAYAPHNSDSGLNLI